MLSSIRFQQMYVQFMMGIIGRGLVTASQIDPIIQKELENLPVDFTFCMSIFSNCAQFSVRVNAQHQLELLKNPPQKAHLTIQVKHLQHAFLVFSFQESTAQAFANDRMIADGDTSTAIRLVRCLNRMESLILPKILASMAVKEYPKNLELKEKLHSARQIYLKLALSCLKEKIYK